MLPEPWKPAWIGPDDPSITSFLPKIVKVGTDEGIVGYGPAGGDPRLLLGVNPFEVTDFWERHMGGRRSEMHGKNAAGLEIALWDIVGKAANLSIAQISGAGRERVPVYAATTRLLPPEVQADQLLQLKSEGFRAAKLRLHRAAPRDDVAAVAAARKAVGDEFVLLADANQNNGADGYGFWDRRTALRVARELDDLGLYFLEEPLPITDVEGLAEIAASVQMYIAGGEHIPTVYDFRPHILGDAYDVIQPDVMLGGNYGITGIRKVAAFADFFGKLVIPHVMLGHNNPVAVPATLHAVASMPNCPMIEYPYDPPFLTMETQQSVLKRPTWIEPDGTARVPQGPGLGIEVDEEQFVEECSVTASHE